MILVVLPTVSRHVYADDKPDNRIDPATGIALIERLESEWYRSSWKSEARNGRLASFTDLDSLEFGPTFCRATVISEPSSGRIRAEIDSVSKWVHGKDPHLAMTAAYGLGGEINRWWEIQTPGVQLPSAGTRGHGQIGPESEENLNMVHASCGFDWFPPCLVGTRLSVGLRSVLELGKTLEIEKKADGTWTIGCFDFTFGHEDEDLDVRLRIDYDPNVGGVVTGATWLGAMPKRPDTIKAWRQMFVTLVDLPGGFRAPARIDLVDLLQNTAGRITFRDVKRNPPADDATFRIRFPRGIHVTDHVHQKVYVVGSGLENDQRAVQAFMKRYELAERQINRSRYYWIVGAAAAVMALLLVMVWARRFWWVGLK